jgi:lipopolysaccharide export LptBFGC system permease protein LptF
VILMLLAIPLGFVNPRAGSSANLIMALLIFFTYNNLTKLVENSVKQSKLSFAVAWWPLHLFALLTVLALFAWRLNVNHRWHPAVLWSAFKRRRLLHGVREPGPGRRGGAMKILQRYFLVNISQAVAFVLVALLGLIAFMDLTSELPAVGKGGYMIQHA